MKGQELQIIILIDPFQGHGIGGEVIQIGIDGDILAILMAMRCSRP
jgi:hypothetical protein